MTKSRFALSAAVNARHEVIQEEDILSAEMLYSQFAFEALLVGNGLSIKQLEDILFEFAGASAIIDQSTVEAFIRAGQIADEKVPYVINRLRDLSFLGVEVKEGSFSYAERGRDFRKVDALSRKLSQSLGRPARYEVHPAYRPFLEIEESLS